jgi:hypothetical protein
MNQNQIRYATLIQVCINDIEFDKELNSSYKDSALKIISNKYISNTDELNWHNKPVLIIDSTDLESYNFHEKIQSQTLPPLEVFIPNAQIMHSSATLCFYFRNNGATLTMHLNKKSNKWVIDRVDRGFN